MAPRTEIPLLAVSADKGENAASGPAIFPPFSSEAAGRNTAAFGFSIDSDSIPFFSISAVVGGQSFAAEQFLTEPRHTCCVSETSELLCSLDGSSAASRAKVEFLTVETRLSSDSGSVVVVVLLDSWQTCSTRLWISVVVLHWFLERFILRFSGARTGDTWGNVQTQGQAQEVLTGP